MWKEGLDFAVLDTDDGLPLVAGTGIEPVYAAYETAEQPLLPSRNNRESPPKGTLSVFERGVSNETGAP